MLEVSSAEIIFDLKNDTYIPYNLSLKNVTSYYLAYKIKSTKPELFSVKQSRGLISPQQSEIVEFSTTDRAKVHYKYEYRKNLDPKHIVNQKFQIYAINVQEKKSIAEIDNLFQTQTCFSIRLFTSIMKEEFGKKVQILGNNLASSHASVLSNSRSESQATMQSMIQPTPLTNQVQCVQKLKQIELELAEEKRKREQLYNTIEIQKLKKGSSFIKFILPIILGILLSNVYQMSLKYYE
ncbi:unnamed protein product (macronuclear) [Paramecium tetraurelia]|uniref:MSP domain-containing protein n=1 Tax=Paramecium tetraurelia TaxID=5888 RepID=A0DBA2_PARTE|nr:uncharacterized protein GSPATT00015213001 [Paramecium tetraurelia]CAK80319.1 unnamed protein product [Paramecium tetraurelia]|eukprot:XP_001447716.1 hypothetical protein (macronuclear) [Paramecium tetraurelia strain d4-2]